jgi:hypothetical protein
MPEKIPIRKIKKKQKPQAGKATLNLFVSMLVGLVTAGLFCTTVYVFATPPASKYTPSETLNPSCTPGSTNCSVLTPVTYTGATAALDLGSYNFTTTGTGTFGTSGILGIDAATNTAGVLKFWSAGANDFYTTFTAGTQTANATYTLPTAMPSGSSKFLQSTTAGVLSWESVDLSGYVPYSGATGAVNLGSQNLTTTGTGTFGTATRQTVLDDGTYAINATGRGYFTNGTGHIVELINTSAGSVGYFTDGTYQARVGGGTEAGYFTGGGKTVYLADSTYAISATGDVSIDSPSIPGGGGINITSPGSSVQIGSGTSVSGASVGIGYQAESTGGDSIGIGYQAQATGGFAVALNGDALADYAIALGTATASSESSIAIGKSAQTNAIASIAIGNYVANPLTTNGDYSIAIGNNIGTTANADYAMVLGYGGVAFYPNSTVIGNVQAGNLNDNNAQGGITLGGYNPNLLTPTGENWFTIMPGSVADSPIFTMGSVMGSSGTPTTNATLNVNQAGNTYAINATGNFYITGDIIFPSGSLITDGTNTSIDPYNRKLYASNGSTIQADYSTAYSLSLAGAGTPVSSSIFAGQDAGYTATSASNSNFLGANAGYGATSAYFSNFLGYNAGHSATSADYSNFLGNQAGYSATSAYSSNFLGNNAGNGATGASNSNFLGYYAGNGATSASNSNFLGYYAGNGATSAYDSNFLGNNAGTSASNAYYSNFLGYYAGYTATSASFSNFLGYYAGYGQTSAGYSVFIGTNAGNNNNQTAQTDFTNNLIIDQALLGSGARATAADIRTNALLYGTFATTAADQQLRINAGSIDMAYIPGAGSGVTIKMDADGYLYGDSSSLRFKSNIQPLEDGFATILQAQPKSFAYNPTGTQEIGFIAEDFDALGLKELVNYDKQGLPSGIKYDRIPIYLLEVLKQQQLDIQEIQQRLGITSDNLTVSPAGTVGSGEVSGVAPSSLLDGLKSLGITISAGVTNFTEIIANKMTATTAKINGLEMVDKTTGQIYCAYIDNGEWQKVLGECSNMVIAQATQSSPEEAPTALTATQMQQVVGQVTQQITPDLQQAAKQAQQAAKQAQQASQKASQANQNAQQAADQAQQAVEQLLSISSVAPISDINVDYGTDLSLVNLPATATVTLSDTTTQSVNILWDNGTPTYDSSTAGNYVFQGTIVPLSNATNTQSLKAQVNVIVAPQEPETPTQEEITPSVGDLIEQGISSFINSAWQFAQWTAGASVKKVASFMPAIKNATANLFQAFQNLGASLTWPVRNLFSR